MKIVSAGSDRRTRAHLNIIRLPTLVSFLVPPPIIVSNHAPSVGVRVFSTAPKPGIPPFAFTAIDKTTVFEGKVLLLLSLCIVLTYQCSDVINNVLRPVMTHLLMTVCEMRL